MDYENESFGGCMDKTMTHMHPPV